MKFTNTLRLDGKQTKQWRIAGDSKNTFDVHENIGVDVEFNQLVVDEIRNETDQKPTVNGI